jgi:two-component system, OmpR family, alkaline phosphatase synthesis response regulator PhoP
MPEAILLIDDDPHLMHVLSTFFDLEGFHVLKAGSGKEAMGVLGELVPDLVMLDLTMPGDEGADVLRQIRANRKLKNIPIVIFTGAEARQDELLAAGADRYIPKPYSLDGLRETVRELIDAKKG